MKTRMFVLIVGFCLDAVLGDPENITHPVVCIGRLISAIEKLFRKVFPDTSAGKRLAGLILWSVVVLISWGIPWAVLKAFGLISPWMRFAAECIMCWQILAARSLEKETMKVYHRLSDGDIPGARKAVSMVVGRDTEKLDGKGITRAAVETVAENTSDGIVAPMLFTAFGGAPLGFLYKAVNTMDSMLGYTEEPFKDIGFVPAKADDVFNYIPARITAMLLLAAGGILRMDVRNGWNIFKRDRSKHASPNAGQTESVCAGLMRIQLGGNAYYHGVLHEKATFGEALREIEIEDIPKACRLMWIASAVSLVMCIGISVFVA